MTSDIKLVTDSEFTEKQLACDYLLPPPEVSKSEAVIAKKDLKAYSDNSIKEYTPNAVHNFVIHPLQDSLVSLDSLKLNIVAVCEGNDNAVTTKDLLLGDFTLMNHISQMTLKIGGADVQTISNPCVIKNMSKLFKYGSIRTQNRELTINGLYPRDTYYKINFDTKNFEYNTNNPLLTSTDVTQINNISYVKGTSGAKCQFIISEIIPLSDIFQVDFSLYPFIYNRKIEVSITWNSEKVVDINTFTDRYVQIKGFRQYYLMYDASILNQDSKNQMIKAYQKKVSALIPNTNYILTSLGSYNANTQMQQTISIPIGFSSESITLFFPNSTTASETYCHADDADKLNTTHHTCNSFRFMNLQKVVVSCGTNVLKTYDFTESATKYENSSDLLKSLVHLENGKDIRNYAIAYDEYLKCECPKVSYPEFLSDYFCLFIDTRYFSQIASNNTLQIDITFGDVDDKIAAGDIGASNQRILGNTAALKQLGVVTKNTKVLSFDPEGSCSVFNVANNILNDYLEL
ncbi:MAG: hypothetical protein SPI36_01665 [Candidatus Onthovivens sp.]|nr:hypothetical protein [Candidatus Onthovivens sp.]